MKKIFPLELKKLMDSDKNEFQLVDIRDEYEYDICCIGGLGLTGTIVCVTLNLTSFEISEFVSP